jgi:DNA-directed RNA polymerase beta subunit
MERDCLIGYGASNLLLVRVIENEIETLGKIDDF